MNSYRHPGLFYRAMLRAAALLVPRSGRPEWLSEWKSELWYLVNESESERLGFAEWSILQFCYGSFRDASWLRHNCSEAERTQRIWFHSPLFCAAILVLLAILTLSTAFFKSLLQSPYTEPYFIVGQPFVLGFALLLIRISTPLQLGEYRAPADSTRRAGLFCWWIFLALKCTLVLIIVFCGTVDLGPIIAPAGMQPDVTLIGYVVGFRWVLVDQRRRCPVCLRLLTHPVRIGQASHIILDWYGTELICARGHGLLHVPQMPRLSHSTQRWVYLDSSWRELFS